MKSDIIKNRIQALSKDQRSLFEEQLRALGESDPNKESDNSKAQIIAYIEGSVSNEDIKNHVKNHLPVYMVPSKFVILKEFPRLPNGKIDYKSLEVESETISAHPTPHSGIKSDLEKKLIAIWEEILKFSPIGIHDNFFEIGGDSILSIQIISKARKEGILLEANQIFEHQTIRELAIHAKNNLPDSESDENIYSGAVNLSPMQHWFFEQHSISTPHLPVTYKLNLKESVSKESIENAVNFIIERHESLRVKFVKCRDSWNAEIVHPDEIQAFSHQNFDDALDLTHSDYSMTDAAPLKVIYLNSESSNDPIVLFLCHNALIDTFSWKIITDEFESILDQIQNDQIVNLSRLDTSYHQWIETLTNYANSEHLRKEIPFWQEQVSNKNSFSFLQKDESLKVEKVIRTATSILDKENSNKLLNEANASYNTRVDDLLIYVLAKTLMDWTKMDSLSLGLACQGREWIDSSIDLSTMVGSLASFFPFKVQLKGSNISDQIKGVKEDLRKITHKGMGYGLLRYYNKSEEIRKSLHFKNEVNFKYLFLEGDNKELLISLEQGKESDKWKLDQLLQINAIVSNNQLHTYWHYDESFIAPKIIQDLIASFELNLKSIIQHCVSSQKTEYTPSDFPESGLNEDELNNLLDLFN